MRFDFEMKEWAPAGEPVHFDYYPTSIHLVAGRASSRPELLEYRTRLERRRIPERLQAR